MITMDNEEFNVISHDIRLKKMRLSNFRGFSNLEELTFHSQVTVLISENGGGKTTVLDAIAIAMKVYLFQMTKSELTPAPKWNRLDLKNGAESGYIELTTELSFEYMDALSDVNNPEITHNEKDEVKETKNLRIDLNSKKISCKIDGHLADETSKFNFGVESASHLREYYRNLPVIVYYGGNYMKPDIMMTNNFTEDNIFQIYANCLEANRFSFQSFLHWFDTINKVAYMPGAEDKKHQRILGFIKQVIEDILNNSGDDKIYQNLRMKYTLIGEDMIIDKKNPEGGFDEVSVIQLSAGEKVMLSLATDIAKRLILANPELSDNPFDGRGVILIDEIDLHLHPNWHSLIIPKLTNTFKNCQFVFTTHSPIVLATIEKDSIRIIKDMSIRPLPEAMGRDYASILLEEMGVDIRPIFYHTQIDYFFKKIYDWNNTDKKGAPEIEIKEVRSELKSGYKRLKELWGENDKNVKLLKTKIEDLNNFLTPNTIDDEQ